MTDQRECEPIIRVAAICGSLRPGSFTRRALHIALEGAQALSAQTQLIDLRDYDLPFCTGLPDAKRDPAGVVRLRQEVRAADGIILGTPIYHGGYSGVVKNALDLMGFDEFEGKILGLVAVSGGAMGGSEALSGLREIGRALHAWVVPQQTALPEAWKLFDENGNLKSAGMKDRLTGVGSEVVRFARLLRCEKAESFIRYWEKATPNPGAEAQQQAGD